MRWSTVPKGSDFFEPSESGFMVNYRVQNLDQLIINLRENGVTVLDSMITVEYGKFIHILDPDGNKIELWEPIDSVLTAFGGETTK